MIMDLINSEIVIVGDDVVKVIDILKFFVVFPEVFVKRSVVYRSICKQKFQNLQTDTEKPT